MLVSNFSKRLDEAMKIRNMKASEIVKKSEELFENGSVKKPLTKPLISNYLKGSYDAKKDNLSVISIILNVDEVWLQGYDVPMEKKAFDLKQTLIQKVLSVAGISENILRSSVEKYLNNCDTDDLTDETSLLVKELYETEWAYEMFLIFETFNCDANQFTPKDDVEKETYLKIQEKVKSDMLETLNLIVENFFNLSNDTNFKFASNNALDIEGLDEQDIKELQEFIQFKKNLKKNKMEK